MKFKTVFWALLVAAILLPPALAQPYPTTNGVIYVPVRINDPILIKSGRNVDGSESLFYLGRGLDGRYSFVRQGDSLPILTEDDLPGGRRLVIQVGNNTFVTEFGVANGTLFFMAYEPNATLSGRPVVAVLSATALPNRNGDGIKAILESRVTTFMAFDPRIFPGVSAQYTYLQAGGFDLSRSGRLTIFTVVQPPRDPGFPVDPAPQSALIQLEGNGTWRSLFNNLQKRESDKDIFYFSQFLNFCSTGSGTIYLAGQATNPAPPTPATPGAQSTASAVFRLQPDRSILQLTQYAEPVGQILSCWDGGTQTYSFDKDGVMFSYVSDSEITGGKLFYKTPIVDTVPLSNRDLAFPTGPNSLFLVTNNRALVRVEGGQAKLYKTPNQAPQGNAIMVAEVNGQTYYLQQEARNNAVYLLYQPSLQSPVSGRQRDVVTLSCKECIVNGILPILRLNLGGSQVGPLRVDPNGNLAFEIPANATVGTYNGTLDVQGVILPLVVNVRGAGELPTPAITSVTNTAGNAGPFSPRQIAYVTFSPPSGRKAEAGDQASFELGGVSMELDGSPVRMIANDGKGRLTVVIPRDVEFKTRANLVLKIRDDRGATATSALAVINISARADVLFHYPDPTDLDLIPILVDEQNRWVGSRLYPAEKDTTVSAFGTGCGAPEGVADDQNVPEPGVEMPGTPILLIGGQTAEVKTIATPFVGVCQYQIKLGQDLFSGPNSIGFPAAQGEFRNFHVK